MSDGPDRGQLLLTGAFVIAVTLIGLTIVLTASNYTQTISDQDDVVVRGGDAVSTRQAVQTDLTRYFYQLETDGSVSESQLRNRFTETVEFIGPRVRDANSGRGRYVNVTQETVDQRYIDGALLEFHMAAGNGEQFVRPTTVTGSGDPKWEMATDVQVRRLNMTITEVNSGSQGRSEAFNLTFQNEGTGNWTFRVYRDTSSTSVMHYEVESPGGYRQSCERSQPSAPGVGHRIDFETGEITEVDSSGPIGSVESCPAIAAIDLDDEHYDVNITGGNAVAGRYSLLVDKDPSHPDVLNNEFDSYTDADVSSALYGANVNYQYYSPTVTYNTTVEIAPEELR